MSKLSSLRRPVHVGQGRPPPQVQVIVNVEGAMSSQWATRPSSPDPRARPTDVFSDLARLGPVVAVVAHPDDESFGLGALLAALATAGAETRLVCFTHGEASTLGSSAELGVIRHDELLVAADVLGVKRVRLADYPDGSLGDVPPAVLDSEIEADLADAAVVVVFEPAGVTGHLDHRAATAAATRVAGRHGLPVLQWGVAPEVAAVLNAEFGTAFVALAGVDVVVDRSVQFAAIACHESQSRDNPVLARRLQLQGTVERIRLRPPGHQTPTESPAHEGTVTGIDPLAAPATTSRITNCSATSSSAMTGIGA